MKGVTPINSAVDPAWYGAQLARDVGSMSRHFTHSDPDYWQKVLLTLHERLAEEFLSDKYGCRYLSHLERKAIKNYLTAQLARFEPLKGEQRLPEPDDWFGVCPICHDRAGTRSDGPDQWGYCLTHGVRWKISPEHLRDWDAEVEDRSEANQRFQASFEAVEAWYGPLND